MSGWPRTAHRRLVLPQPDTLDWGAIAPRVIGDQLELLGQHASLVLSPDLDAAAGSLAALASSGGAAFASWPAARLIARNAAAGLAPCLFALAGIAAPGSSGTAGHQQVPNDLNELEDVESGVADDVVDGRAVWRRPVGFALSGGALFDGASPLRALGHVEFRSQSFYAASGLLGGSRSFGSGRISESGNVSAGTPGEFWFPFIVPADHAGWHDGAGEADLAAWLTVRQTGTLSCSLSMIDTAGAASSSGPASSTVGADVRVGLPASAMAGLTFAPGGTAHLVATFASGASGGTATVRLMPQARYESSQRGNL